MKTRAILNDDLPALQAAIDADTFHPVGTWKVEHFSGFSEVIESNGVPAVFVHYVPEEGMSLRIETVWVDSFAQGNARVIIYLVKNAAKRASEAGFVNLCFSTEHDKLAKFTTQVLGFKSIGGNEYVLEIGK